MQRSRHPCNYESMKTGCKIPGYQDGSKALGMRHASGEVLKPDLTGPCTKRFVIRRMLGMVSRQGGGLAMERCAPRRSSDEEHEQETGGPDQRAMAHARCTSDMAVKYEASRVAARACRSHLPMSTIAECTAHMQPF
ncbi:MAG: hypothetical protein D6690_05085 [Nitrospirae bacterium]|nr:MAG: hypothetical protein D6690_05085 [Nitrospirota bacterium]